MKLTPELMNNAKAAKSAEELAELAKKNGVEMTADEATKYFDQLNAEGALSDEELENATGGGLFWDDYTDIYCMTCGWTTQWKGKYNQEFFTGPCPVCGDDILWRGEYHSC